MINWFEPFSLIYEIKHSCRVTSVNIAIWWIIWKRKSYIGKITTISVDFAYRALNSIGHDDYYFYILYKGENETCTGIAQFLQASMKYQWKRAKRKCKQVCAMWQTNRESMRFACIRSHSQLCIQTLIRQKSYISDFKNSQFDHVTDNCEYLAPPLMNLSRQKKNAKVRALRFHFIHVDFRNTENECVSSLII